MIKFFRKIRYNLMEQNKTGKYFKYAIGEIVLVVIGILIALSINNWNEKNKLKKEESKILTEIRKSLKGDLRYLKVNLRTNSESKRELNIIKEQFELDKPTNDSLNYFYSSILFTNSVDITTGPYETLKSKGLDLISNDSLRNNVVLFYEQTVKYYIDKDFYLDRKFTVEYCTKLFNSVAFFSDSGRIPIFPNDYESLKQDKVFSNLLNTKIEEIGFKNRVLNNAQEEIENLTVFITNEIEKK